MPFIGTVQLRQWADMAQKDFSAGMARITSFYEGAQFYVQKQDAAVALFMLHQVCELSCRALTVGLLGSEKRSHKLQEHEKHLALLLPNFKLLPSIADGVTDASMLTLLNKAYTAVRYESKFKVEGVDMEKICEFALSLSERVSDMMKEYLVQFNELVQQEERKETNATYAELTSATKAEPSVIVDSREQMQLADDKLKEIVNCLKENIDIKGIYLFGRRTRSFFIEGINAQENKGSCDYFFDLLIVSERDIREQIRNIQATINQEREVFVLLLSFTQVQIQKQLDKNSPFFHQALQYFEPLHYAENHLLNWEFHERNGCRNADEMDEARSKWYQRENNARGFYNGGKAIQDCEEVEIKVFLYNQAIEQACLGLLEYFYGYAPYQYNLKHLFSLCASLWQFPNDIFPRSTEEEKSLFDEFAQTVKDTRYQGWSMVGWDEAYRYDTRCECFLEQCSRLVRG
ncbi:HEPN domain-containing protein [Pedobacter sp. SL55]|uniref:HEPN domain-containing protein n=1 Tax=Pedobacter sp. SL55 TaxID=2995161 RepID=UPI002272138C|nr:HEPN domain-containing protein [Pedobacter sp. SL55]WAC41050.1 HEPN domain-containing protein [Pedobacter sp. SL55]